MKKILTLLVIPLLVCCSTDTSYVERSKSRHTYDEIKDRLIHYDDILSLPYDYYFLYFFSRTCFHCEEIKNQMIEYCIVNKELFLVEIYKDEKHNFYYPNYQNPIICSSKEDVWLGVTPQLAIIVDHTFAYSYVGDEITNLLNL